MLVEAPKGGKSRVNFVTKIRRGYSDCWLLNVGVNIEEVKNKINDLLTVASADIVKSV